MPDWRTGRPLTLLLAVAALLLSSGVALAAGGARVALVVGNSDYRSVGRLANPGNDARLVARTLKASGFTLIGGDAQLDLDKPRFDAAVQRFGQAIQHADVALFYYSGHGLQVSGTNFLVPVDANPSRLQDLDFQMVSADLVLRQMSGSGTKLNIIILDACRNNPFSGRGLRSAGGGLAEMKAPEGTLISYATQPGAVASDGAGRDSPYTLALVDAMRQPGLDIFRTFNRVGLTVKRTTDGQQQPWLAASPIEGEFAFSAAGIPAPPAPPPPSTATETAALAPPLRPGTAMSKEPEAAPPQVVPGGFRCPANGVTVAGEDETFNWDGDKVEIRAVTGGWTWRSLGADPANPLLCRHVGRSGTAHRLAGWFDLDRFDYQDDPAPLMLAMLSGQSDGFSERHMRKGSVLVLTTNWKPHGRERLTIGGRSYDTLVFDIRGASSRNTFTGEGRVWYAPALGLFVRKFWRAAISEDVIGWTVTNVSGG